MRLPAQLQQGARAARILPSAVVLTIQLLAMKRASARGATWTQGKPVLAYLWPALKGRWVVQVTAILYANPGWSPADGGKLRLWPPPMIDPASTAHGAPAAGTGLPSLYSL